jgi:hypothetical protein
MTNESTRRRRVAYELRQRAAEDLAEASRLDGLRAASARGGPARHRQESGSRPRRPGRRGRIPDLARQRPHRRGVTTA